LFFPFLICYILNYLNQLVLKTGAKVRSIPRKNKHFSRLCAITALFLIQIKHCPQSLHILIDPFPNGLAADLLEGSAEPV